MGGLNSCFRSTETIVAGTCCFTTISKNVRRLNSTTTESIHTARNSSATFHLPYSPSTTNSSMTHAQLVERAVRWLRAYRCGVVLSEQACVSGEMPDAIGWKRASHSVLVECKVTRADFLADRGKPFRTKPEQGVGCERFYLTPPSLVKIEELAAGWG